MAPQLNKCPQCGSTVAPHIACPSCGYYKGRQVLTISGNSCSGRVSVAARQPVSTPHLPLDDGGLYNFDFRFAFARLKFANFPS